MTAVSATLRNFKLYAFPKVITATVEKEGREESTFFFVVY